MIEHETLCVGAASAWARVDTLVPHAGAILRAVCVQDALRATADVRIALVLGQTATGSIIAAGIGPTGRGCTGVGENWVRYERNEPLVSRRTLRSRAFAIQFKGVLRGWVGAG